MTMAVIHALKNVLKMGKFHRAFLKLYPKILVRSVILLMRALQISCLSISNRNNYNFPTCIPITYWSLNIYIFYSYVNITIKGKCVVFID